MLFWVTAVGGAIMIVAAMWVMMKPFEDESEEKESPLPPRERVPDRGGVKID